MIQFIFFIFVAFYILATYSLIKSIVVCRIGEAITIWSKIIARFLKIKYHLHPQS